MWRSLKTRIVGFTLTIFLFSIWLLALYSSHVMREDVQRLLGQQQLSVAASIATRIDGDIEDRLNTLIGYADALDADLLGRREGLQVDIEKHRFLSSPFNGGVMVLDQAGQVIAGIPLQVESAKLDYSGQDFFTAVIRDGKPGIGKPARLPKLDVPVVGIAAPVRNTQGKIIGVVVGLTRLDKPSFLDQVPIDSLGKVEDVIVVSRQHRTVVTASDKQRVGELLAGPGRDFVLDQRASGGEGTEVFVNEQGVQVLSSAKAVPAANWYVEVSLTTAQAYSTIELAQRRLAVAALLVTLLALGLSWGMVHYELMPLSQAVQALAQKRESGKPRQALLIRRDDEIGALLGAFNDVVARLNQREALFRQILDTSSVAIFVVDQQGRITQANRCMAEMFGCSSRDMVGREYVELVDPSERDVARQRMLALLDSTLPLVESDRLYWRDDASTFWGHLSGKRFVDAQGQEQGLIGVIADITERKLIEGRLQRHDQRMSAIIEHFPGGISMIDQDLHLVAHNPQFKKLLEFPDSLFEKSDLSLEDLLRFNAQRGEYGPGDIEQQVNERLARARKFEPHKFERVRPDGTVLEVQGAIVPGGGFVTIYLDITERKRQEDAVHQSEISLRRFRIAMDASRDAIFLVDRDSMRFVDVNAGVERVLGLTREQAFELGPAGILDIPLDELAAAYDATIAGGGIAAPIERKRKRPDGETIWLEIRRHAQNTGDGWLIVSVVHDITERKKVEEQVRQLAFYDPLTKLANRRLFNDRLSQSLAASRRSGAYGALMFLDLDHFKALNDTHGHAAGDLLLIEAAARLTSCVRQVDTVARLGGDEFVVVIDAIGMDMAACREQANVIAEKIAVSLAQPYHLAIEQDTQTVRSVEHRCSASIGVVVFVDRDGSQEDFLKRADGAMYQAKQAGRNLIRFSEV